jgi:hypothetical protein
VFAQRFALMHELVKLDDELECMCELWRAVEVITSGAWGEEWTNGKGARRRVDQRKECAGMCLYCQKGETECKL